MWVLIAIVTVLLLIAGYDVVQRRNSILRNFPVIGHLRFLLEGVGPELRQYIVTSNDEERPFSRDQREWVYGSAHGTGSYVGFGTDNEVEQSSNYVIVKQAAFPLPRPPAEQDALPCAKVLGAARGRAKAFRPESLVNVSAMSFGSLSAPAIQAIGRGCAAAGCLHNVGEGGLSPYHGNGAGLVFQIGTGYFGCRTTDGRFELSRLVDLVAANPIRAIEIKLSQGAKPGLGGVLSAVKVTPEIAAIRGVPVGVDCVSPSGHSAFHDVDSMLDFVERVATATGVPVGIKSAVGEGGFWDDLVATMSSGTRGVDFVTIDGGEGGSGAAPRTFSDHVAFPFKIGFSRVYRAFAKADLQDSVVFVGSGKCGLPDTALLALALGCDMVNVAREAMMAIGCIQAQRCQSGHCPAGVATQSRWLSRGLDPASKSPDLEAYVRALRHELLQLAHACGVEHPALITTDQVDVLDGRFGSVTLAQLFDYPPMWGLPGRQECATIVEVMSRLNTPVSSQVS
jgi:glutamate synthase domain-containing protein 2